MDHNSTFELSREVFAIVNVPASIFSIFMNIFFIHCIMFYQRENQQLKPPLNVLQEMLIGCNITINICTLLKVCMNFFPSLYCERTVVSKTVVYTMMTSVTSSFWQNVFYFCQITPAQSHFAWLKKNISTFIYCAVPINELFYLIGLSLHITMIVFVMNRQDDILLQLDNDSQLLRVAMSSYLVVLMTFCLVIINLCGMSISCCATVFYLWNHLKNMEENCTLSSPRFPRQIGLIIISIATHSILHFICSVGLIASLYIQLYTGIVYDSEENIVCTIVSVYAVGTSIVQFTAQSLYRNQLMYSCKKIF